MPFNPKLIKVSKSNDKYINLVHGEDTITFSLKECNSHFGLSFSKKFKNYSIGINIKDMLFSRLKSVEEKAEEFLDRPLTKPLLRCLFERDEYKTLYLKLKPDQFDEDMLDVESATKQFYSLWFQCAMPTFTPAQAFKAPSIFCLKHMVDFLVRRFGTLFFRVALVAAIVCL